jgi:hypothetical protein
VRCLSCDCELTNFESTRKYNESGEYIDLCGRCLSDILPDLETVERFDLFDPDIDIIDGGTSIEADDGTIIRADPDTFESHRDE